MWGIPMVRRDVSAAEGCGVSVAGMCPIARALGAGGCGVSSEVQVLCVAGGGRCWLSSMSDCARGVVLSDSIDSSAGGGSRGSEGIGVHRSAPFCQGAATLCDRLCPWVAMQLEE